jgi:2-amino-4-deoxychorismate synthase
VRHSDPMAEAAETTAKANGLLNAFLGAARNTIGDDARIQAALRERNNRVASFWLSGGTRLQSTGLARKRILVLDAEDDFTRMLAQQLQALGLEPQLVPVSQWRGGYDRADLVLLGPGPGNPLDDRDPRIVHMKNALSKCFSEKTPFLAVCLSHQILAAYLGLKVERLPHPNQGVQREIDYFGRSAVVGFYNTFAARSSFDSFCTGGMSVSVARDVTTGQVHALRGEFFSSMQFHPESVLSLAGTSLLATELERIAGVEAEPRLSLAISNSQAGSVRQDRRTSA